MTKKMTRTALFAVAAVLVLAAICTAIALGTTSASALEISGNSSDQASKSQNVTVTYNVSGGWTVSFDETSFDLTPDEAQTLNVEVKSAVLEDGKHLSVEVTSENNYTLKHGDDALAYTVKKGGTALNNDSNKTIIEGIDGSNFSSAGAKAALEIEITRDSASAAKYSGEYKDTLNFNVEVA